MSIRKAFTLIEVLAATALFGLAVAALFMAFVPTHDALHRLSTASGDTAERELVRVIAEASADRATLLRGGDVPLPGGGTLRWKATVEPTAVEALFRLNLTTWRAEAEPETTEYLHFNPRWLEASDGKPQWLEHSAGTPGTGGGGTPPAGGAGGKPATPAGARPPAPGRPPASTGGSR
jgi:prepilin-type N-terminal cleavage/methylation domain-containing protein